MHPRTLLARFPFLAVVGLLLAGPPLALPPAVANGQSPTEIPALLAEANDSPSVPLWTTWGAPQYALADDGQFLWIGATGGVVRWDKQHNTQQRYGAVDGLLHSAVLAVAVDGVGNRWFGGDGGLSRLDANGLWTHYTPANSGLHRTLVDSIAIGADNTLWVSHGLPDGPISRRDPDGAWFWHPDRATVTGDYPRIVQSPAQNQLWTVVNGEVWLGFLVYTGSQWIDRTPAAGQAPPHLLRADGAGNVWALVNGQYAIAGLLKWEHATWSTIDLYGYFPFGGSLATFALAPDNSVWLGLEYRDFPYTHFVAALAKLEPNPSLNAFDGSPPVTAMLANAEGVWAIGPQWLRTPDGTVHHLADTVAYATITDVALDGNDVLWLNSYTARPDSYSVGVLQTLSDQGSTPLADDGWNRQAYYDILLAWERTPDGDLLSAWGYKWRFGWSYSSTLRRDRGGAVIEVPLPTTNAPTAINDIFAQDDRRIWLAYTRGHLGADQEYGVFALDDNGTPADFADDRWQDFPIATAGAGGAVAVDAQERLWYGNSVNLYEYTEGQWRPLFASEQRVCDLTPDGEGMLYVLEASTTHCNTLSGLVGIVAPDNTYTTAAIGNLVAARLPALRATSHRNRLWTVAPDGAVWYLARRFLPEAGLGFVDGLHRYGASSVTDYPLPAAVAAATDGGAAAVQRLEVDAHNHVWLVAADQLWRMSPAPDFVLEVQPSSWLLTPAGVRTGEIAIRSREGYSGTLTLAVTNAPADITVTIEPNPVPVDQAARITLSAAPTSVPGAYPLLIQASDNQITHTVSVNLTVWAELHDLYLPAISR